MGVHTASAEARIRAKAPRADLYRSDICTPTLRTDDAGTWIALSDYANQGQLYPPIYDEETRRYGGTVFMPVGILLRSFAANLTGEGLISAKLLSASTMTT